MFIYMYTLYFYSSFDLTEWFIHSCSASTFPGDRNKRCPGLNVTRRSIKQLHIDDRRWTTGVLTRPLKVYPTSKDAWPNRFQPGSTGRHPMTTALIPSQLFSTTLLPGLSTLSVGRRAAYNRLSRCKNQHNTLFKHNWSFNKNFWGLDPYKTFLDHF